MKPPPKETQDEYRRLIDAAYSGQLAWLHKIIIARGYFGKVNAIQARHAARLFGVTPQAVGLWARRDGCPKNENGSYNYHDILAWRINREANRIADNMRGASSGDPLLMGESTDSLDQYRRVKTKQAKFDLDVKKGDYVLREEVDRKWGELGRQIGTAITELEKRFPDAAELLRARISAFTFTERKLENE